MFLALSLWLCNAMSCQVYVIDTFDAGNDQDCYTQLARRADSLANVWNDDKSLTDWLKEFNVKQDLKLINDYDFTCEMIADSDIP